MSTITENEQPTDQSTGGTSRRVFLGWIGMGGTAGFAVGCQGGNRAATPGPAGGADLPHSHHDAPGPAPDGGVHANRDALQFFNHHQALTVDAACGRIIPGTPDDPGAREAAVVFYIDHMLATHTGYPSPAYMEGPFAQPYEGDEPPPPEDGVVWVPADELERYGRQSPFPPQDLYRMGLARLDALCQERFGSDFVDLDDDQQDEVLAAIEDEEDDDVTEVFGELPAAYFFDQVRTHTMEGFLSDPVYGGNRDMVGWRLVGFPGSRRSYSPADMHNENFDVTPQSLLDLPPFNADHDHSHGSMPAVRSRHPKGPID